MSADLNPDRPNADDVIRDWRVPVLEHGLRRPQTFVIDAAHLHRQREWSRRTFGPGSREGGVIDHIRKELAEIKNAPTTVDEKLKEWVDVVILALDGAWRCGASPQQILDAIEAKQTRNEAREWPDWRTLSED